MKQMPPLKVMKNKFNLDQVRMSTQGSSAPRQRKKTMPDDAELRQPLLPSAGSPAPRGIWRAIADFWRVCVKQILAAYQRFIGAEASSALLISVARVAQSNLMHAQRCPPISQHGWAFELPKPIP